MNRSLVALLAAPFLVATSHADPPKSLAPAAAISSFADLRSEIAAMRVDDVAWRKIEWRTCLLDGLKASREQAKPVILWMFIDLPVDDKRC